MAHSMFSSLKTVRKKQLHVVIQVKLLLTTQMETPTMEKWRLFIRWKFPMGSEPCGYHARLPRLDSSKERPTLKWSSTTGNGKMDKCTGKDCGAGKMERPGKERLCGMNYRGKYVDGLLRWLLSRDRTGGEVEIDIDIQVEDEVEVVTHPPLPLGSFYVLGSDHDTHESTHSVLLPKPTCVLERWYTTVFKS